MLGVASVGWVGGSGLGARGRAVGVLAAVVGLSGLLAVAFAGSAAASACGADGVFSRSGATAACAYSYTGSEQTFTVPAGVGSVGVTAVGAPGGTATSPIGPEGGSGAVVTATVPLPLGADTLYVDVGGTGAGGTGVRAFNGGGSSPGGAGGGGASDVRTVSCDSPCSDPASLSSRLVVAGGGGGGPLSPSCIGSGGAAGDTSVTGPGNGGAGTDFCGFPLATPGGNGGFGGTAGGLGGSAPQSACIGGSGSLGQGGNALPCVAMGGGGGGGYYGGGAGGGGEDGSGGGGAGSSFWASDATGTSLSENTTATAPASVTISYTVPAAPKASITSPAGGAAYAVGEVVHSSFSCSEGAGGTGVSSCLDQRGHPSGAVVDTSTAGRHTFTVTATSKGGLTATASATYTVAGAPSAAISSPVSGATFTRGQLVEASYECREGTFGPGLASCAGAVAAGAPISTGTVGAHSLTVTAISKDGQRATATVSYTVVMPDNRFAISHVHARPNGRVSFRVAFPGPGIADVMETAWLDNFARATVLLGPAKGRFVFARKHLNVSAAETRAITVTPNKRGRKLIAHHRYQVAIRLWVSYTPTNGTQRDIGLYGLHITRAKHHHHHG
jgi:glycine rich protein